MNPGESDESFRPGAALGGKYVVERQIAEGGIGVIVAATHTQLGQRVAIKYLKPSVLEHEVLVERFKREAQLAASLRSEHVVRVFDVGALEHGAPYMVMEYLEGEDLASVISRGPLPTQLAVDYVLQACDAIAEAHSLGIVHRDLKPENLFLAEKGAGLPVVKILDFGISKSIGTSVAGKRLRQMTEDNERFGTPVYMSPEQLLSSTNVDARSDIWALGVVLFELLTTTMPFIGENVAQLTARIQSGAAGSLRDRCPGASDDLEAVILRCLQKDPQHRYRNVAELAQDLVPFGLPASQQRLLNIERIVRGSGQSIRAPRPSHPDADARSAPTLVRTDGAILTVSSGGTLDAVSSPKARTSRTSYVAWLTAVGAMAVGGALFAASAARVRQASGTTPALAGNSIAPSGVPASTPSTGDAGIGSSEASPPAPGGGAAPYSPAPTAPASRASSASKAASGSTTPRATKVRPAPIASSATSERDDDIRARR